jgi:hypothetical protein
MNKRGKGSPIKDLKLRRKGEQERKPEYMLIVLL